MSQNLSRSLTGAEVSMKSGLEGRNNMGQSDLDQGRQGGLNEVRPRRPEQ